jgi:hypothetical protein
MARTLMAFVLFVLLCSTVHGQCPTSPPFDGMLLSASDFSGSPMKLSLDEPYIASSPSSPVSPARYSQRKVWQSNDSLSPVWQLFDIRLIFNSDLEASEFIKTQTRINFLSEGAPKESEILVDGVNVTIYGPRNKKIIDMAATLGIPADKFKGYSYIFQHQNVVSKVFIYKKIDTVLPMTSRSVLPLVATAINKIKTFCSTGGDH